MNKDKRIVYIDLDDTIVNFNSSTKIPSDEKHIYNHPEIYKPDFFLELKPFAGCLKIIKEKVLVLEDYDFWICTQPVAGSPISYYEKAEWVKEHLPELVNKIVMTQDKTLCLGWMLIDDSKKWAGFPGIFYHFSKTDPRNMWLMIAEVLKNWEENSLSRINML